MWFSREKSTHPPRLHPPIQSANIPNSSTSTSPVARSSSRGYPQTPGHPTQVHYDGLRPSCLILCWFKKRQLLTQGLKDTLGNIQPQDAPSREGQSELLRRQFLRAQSGCFFAFWVKQYCPFIFFPWCSSFYPERREIQ